MIKLKDYISEYAKMLDSYDEVETFLKDFHVKYPDAKEDEVADAIVQFLYQKNREVDESIASMALKYVLPALMSIYGSNAIKILDLVKDKLKTRGINQYAKVLSKGVAG